MGIFTKLSTLIKSNINDLINRAENPEKMLNQIILDMRDQLAKAKREVAAAIADERKLRSQLDDEVKQAKEWEQRAMLAVKEGRDDLAKQALVRHQEHAERAAAIDQTWRAQAQETEKLKASLRQLNEKIDEAKRKRNLLIAKQKRAQAQRRIHETMSGLSDTSAFEAFNRMADKIEESERRSLAAAEVDEALAGDTLETEFLKLEAGGADAGVDDRLLALKQQMGLLPSAAEEPKQLEAGQGGDAAAEAAAAADANVQDAEVEAVEDGPEEESHGDEVIAEAELLERFKDLEKNAEA
ncbi:MAG: PspA/IM30 family protein [Gemmatimonadales bacterium]|nr:MAG: PspA/IM30 family protein [Gemmatimonadales bacterium]